MRTKNVTGSRLGDFALNFTAWLFGATIATPVVLILAAPFVG